MPEAQVKKLGGKSHRRLKELLFDAREGISLGVRARVKNDKVPVNAESAAGLTALFYAVRGQRYKITRFLIEQGGDVNAPLPRQPSLLDVAETLHDKKLTRILTDAGATRKPAKQLAEERKSLPRWPTMIDFKNTEYPLYEAAITGDEEAFAEIAETLSQKRLQALLTEACIEHEVEFGKALIPCVKNIDFDREDAANPLYEASVCGCLPLVQALYQAGAKKGLVESVENATMGGHVDVVATLLEPMLELARKKLKRVRADESELQRILDGCAQTAVKDGYTALAEVFLPHCSERAADRVRKGIDGWRAKHGEDSPTDCFAGYRGEAEEPDEDPFADPGYLWMDEDSLKRCIKRAVDKKVPLNDRLAALKTLEKMGPNAATSVPTLNKLTQDPEKRIRRAVQKTLNAVR